MESSSNNKNWIINPHPSADNGYRQALTIEHKQASRQALLFDVRYTIRFLARGSGDEISTQIGKRLTKLSAHRTYDQGDSRKALIRPQELQICTRDEEDNWDANQN